MARPFDLLRIASQYGRVRRYVYGPIRREDRGQALLALEELRQLADDAVVDLQRTREALGNERLEEVACQKLLKDFRQDGDSLSETLQVALDAYSHCKAEASGLRDDVEELEVQLAAAFETRLQYAVERNAARETATRNAQIATKAQDDLAAEKVRNARVLHELVGLRSAQADFLKVLRPHASEGARITDVLESILRKRKIAIEERDAALEDLASVSAALNREVERADFHFRARRCWKQKYLDALVAGIGLETLGEGQIVLETLGEGQILLLGRA